MIGQVSIGAAVAVVGYDLFQNTTWQVSSKPRVIKAIAGVGSTAINDCEFDFFVEDKLIGHFYNSRAGVLAPLQEDIIPLGNRFVPVGSKISAIMTVAPTANPINVIVY